ncbi:hypothetical protein ACN27F_34225 [Solwaraspora sp. WMMB335]|uniref:hypothetical protein n=1 Tax=Solwaraspora sp. WMMB335 TaxID=3404118 RepID=UPI003B9371C0
MMDPVVLAIAAAAAGKGAEVIVSDSSSALGALLRMIRNRLRGVDRESSELDEVISVPGDTARRDALIGALSRELAADPRFAMAVHDQWCRAREELGTSGDFAVRNEVSGSTGTVVQARDIIGGITF